jgi:catechol 2,3-dioxygenase-like lactoylglutathione lyase family enzyme
VSAAGLDHVGLTVSDLDRSLAFWRDAIGFAETGRGVVSWEHLDRLTGLDGTEIEWVGLALPDGTALELQQYRRPAGRPLALEGENDPGRSHVGLRVADVDGLAARLTQAGAPLRSAGPVALERGAYAGWRAVYALDPDGHSVELMEPPRGDGAGE